MLLSLGSKTTQFDHIAKKTQHLSLSEEVDPRSASTRYELIKPFWSSEPRFSNCQLEHVSVCFPWWLRRPHE